MYWDISRISIPVFDLKESKRFYEFLLNEDYSTSTESTDENEIFISGGNCELRLYKLLNFLSEDNKFQSRRSYPSILIKDLSQIIENLNQKEIKFLKSIYITNPLTPSIIIQETSLNFIELIDNKSFLNTKSNLETNKWEFHHINLESYNVRLSVNFITNFLKIKEGDWIVPEKLGDVNIDKKQLSIFPTNINLGGIHINKADFTFCLRNGFLHNPTIGGHPAFRVKDINKFIVKLEKNKIPFTDAKIYAMPNIYQIYLYDPNANIIEINQLVT